MQDRAYEPGDLVKHLPTGKVYDVDAFFPGDQYRPPAVTLSRTSAGPGWARGTVLDTSPENVRLVEAWNERTMFPGDRSSR